LLAYVLPYRLKLAAAQVCALIHTLSGLAFPFFMGRLIDGAQHFGRSTTGGPLRLSGDLSINTIAFILVLILSVQAVCSFVQTYWMTEIGERSLAALRRDTYAHLIRLPMSFFTQRRVGELASRIASDLTLIQGTLTGALPQLIAQLILMAGGITLIALTSVRLTLVMLATFPVAIGMTIVFGRKTRKVSRETQDKLADTHVILEETLQGIANVKAFANEDYETTRYRAGIDALIGIVLRWARFQGAYGAFFSVILFGSMILVMWYGVRLVEQRSLTFGELTRFLMYTMYIGGATGQFARLYGELQRTLGATQRVRELLDEQAEDLDSNVDDLSGTGQDQPLRVAGDVEFERVTFAYPSRAEVVVLRELSLRVRAGQRVALVGPSGAGKSTIVSLLLRFYDPDTGHIAIDGRDARDYPLRALRNQMAIVPQDVLLFGGTIADNIAYGRPEASPAEIEAAARQANAHEFIAGFPEGYETLVGDRGVKLSGGQRQRVAIARAILKDPAILILDEATSSLDSENERLVQQALDSLMVGRTSIIIAHRLATVRRADRIFVIQEGEVIESGTHEELMAHDVGVYRTLSELQSVAAETEV
jgi:ATP-binding cassette subfamily B protein